MQTTVLPPSPAAGTRSGTISASAPNMASTTRYPVRARAAQAAGSRGLRILPSGARTSMARKTPALFGDLGLQHTTYTEVGA